MEKAAHIFDVIRLTVSSGAFRRITFSRPKDPDTVRMTAKPFLKNGSLLVQFERFSNDGKAYHKNLEAAEAANEVLGLCGGDFGQVHVLTDCGECTIGYSKKGKLLVNNHIRPGGAPTAAASGHDRERHYFLRDREPCAFLQLLGVSDEKGNVYDKKRAKFRQINHFLKIVDDVYDKLPRNGVLRICDLCCGKSYLTFAVYYYFTEIRRRTVAMTGMDLKKDVIALCQETAETLGWTSLSFLAGDIGSYAPAQPPHLVISLHACDTATDLVLYHANRLGADVILSTPCCHHEMFHQMQQQGVLSPITAHSMLKQKLCDSATDALRAKWLEYMGYRVDTLELIDPEETPKNLMIRAVKRKNAFSPQRRTAFLTEYNALCDFLGVEPYLKQYMTDPTATIPEDKNTI